ncbi:hypothetical protein Q5P01_017232 [Channa striata]|uniref:Uncharacterized protein n=1 Tax=Channa striata TaxID=64152 RepID=A0AA88M9N2_CHASR|nr:hypothetical protein Q5P01_017232 [Channa striata]
MLGSFDTAGKPNGGAVSCHHHRPGCKVDNCSQFPFSQGEAEAARIIREESTCSMFPVLPRSPETSRIKAVQVVGEPTQ